MVGPLRAVRAAARDAGLGPPTEVTHDGHAGLEFDEPRFMLHVYADGVALVTFHDACWPRHFEFDLAEGARARDWGRFWDTLADRRGCRAWALACLFPALLGLCLLW